MQELTFVPIAQHFLGVFFPVIPDTLGNDARDGRSHLRHSHDTPTLFTQVSPSKSLAEAGHFEVLAQQPTFESLGTAGTFVERAGPIVLKA